MKDINFVMNNLFCGRDNVKKDRYAWNNETECKEFLEFIVNYVDQHNSLISNDFYYLANIPNLYNPFDYEMFLRSLYKFVSNYASKHNLDCKNDTSYCIKLNHKLYRIELIIGLGTCIEFSRVKDTKDVSYIVYQKMMEEL